MLVLVELDKIGKVETGITNTRIREPNGKIYQDQLAYELRSFFNVDTLVDITEKKINLSTDWKLFPYNFIQLQRYSSACDNKSGKQILR